MTTRLAILATCVVALFDMPAAAQQPKPRPEDKRDGPAVLKVFSPIVKSPSEATVRILAEGKEVCLGVIVGADGWVMTKWDEIKDRQALTCKLKDGTEVPARVVGVQANFDLALLHVDAAELPTIEWRSSQDAKVGKWVAAVGPSDIPVAVGVISVATRHYRLGDQPPRFTKVNAGWLGIALEEAEGGARITTVAPKSPAQKAGCKKNDVVYQAAGQPITDPDSLINIVQKHKAGDTVVFKIKRGKEDVEVKATLEKMPKEMLGNPQERMGNELSIRRGGFPTILQHDTVVKPRDCGGPLVDLDGKAVGLNICRAGRTESYAIPSEVVLSLLDDLKSGRLALKDTPPAKTPLLPNLELVLRSVNTLAKTDPADKSREGSQHAKVYDVNLAAGTPHLVELDSQDFDTYLIVEDSTGKKVAEDNNSGGDLNARLIFTPPKTGVYRIIATSFATGETGAFTLSVRKQGEGKKDASK